MRLNAIREVDVGIIGGGPAGAALAIELAQIGHSTIVIERSNYRGVRVGETLPPAVQPLLSRLAVWDRFLAQKHSPSFATRSAWGQAELYDNDFIFNPYGAGWHVDRTRLDSMLARSAEHAGSIVFRDARVSSCTRNRDRWEIHVASVDGLHSILAKFLVDATGRSSRLAAKQGARRVNSDHLIGVIKFFPPNRSEPSPESFTLIESVETGWWYSAVLPDSTLVAAFMTDADLYADGCRHVSDYWITQLQASIHTRSRVSSYGPASLSRVVPANSSLLKQPANGNCMAIGDAAMAFDPLSGQGICKALKSASRAAESIGDYLAGNKAATRDYATATAKDYDSYLKTRADFYSRERRWSESAFWRRRQRE